MDSFLEQLSFCSAVSPLEKVACDVGKMVFSELYFVCDIDRVVFLPTSRGSRWTGPKGMLVV